MEWNPETGTGLKIEGARIHFRDRGFRAARTMPYGDCTGVALRLAPSIGGLGMSLRYQVDLLGRESEAAITIAKSGSLAQARKIRREAAEMLKKPAVDATPDGIAGDDPAGPPPPNVGLGMRDGHWLVTVRRSKLEYLFIAAIAVGLGAILILGERSPNNAVFLVMAAGLLGYALYSALSVRFIEIADGRMKIGTRSSLGDFASVEMDLAEIDTVLWGKAGNRIGQFRSAFVVTAGDSAKSFERLTEDQARWLMRFVREARRAAA